MLRFSIRYFGWILVGISGALMLTGGFSIGVFFVPVTFGLTLLLLLTRRHNDGYPAEAPGVFVGIGLLSFFIVTVNPDWWGVGVFGAALIALGVYLPTHSGYVSRAKENLGI